MTCRDIFFAGVPGAVRLHDCEGLLPALGEFFRFWPHAPQPEGLPAIPGTPPSARRGPRPLLAIFPQGRGYPGCPLPATSRPGPACCAVWP